jgi:hypothetical protein
MKALQELLTALPAPDAAHRHVAILVGSEAALWSTSLSESGLAVAGLWQLLGAHRALPAALEHGGSGVLVVSGVTQYEDHAPREAAELISQAAANARARGAMPTLVICGPSGDLEARLTDHPLGWQIHRMSGRTHVFEVENDPIDVSSIDPEAIDNTLPWTLKVNWKPPVVLPVTRRDITPVMLRRYVDGRFILVRPEDALGAIVSGRRTDDLLIMVKPVFDGGDILEVAGLASVDDRYTLIGELSRTALETLASPGVQTNDVRVFPRDAESSGDSTQLVHVECVLSRLLLAHEAEERKQVIGRVVGPLGDIFISFTTDESAL